LTSKSQDPGTKTYKSFFVHILLKVDRFTSNQGQKEGSSAHSTRMSSDTFNQRKCFNNLIILYRLVESVCTKLQETLVLL